MVDRVVSLTFGISRPLLEPVLYSRVSCPTSRSKQRFTRDADYWTGTTRDDPTPARGNQLMRASSLVLASLGFVHDFRTGQLAPDEFRGTPREHTIYRV